MKDGLDPFAGCRDGRLILKVAGERLDSECIQLGVSLPAEDSNLIAARDKLLDDVSPEKSASAGDKCSHEIHPAVRPRRCPHNVTILPDRQSLPGTDVASRPIQRGDAL